MKKLFISSALASSNFFLLGASAFGQTFDPSPINPPYRNLGKLIANLLVLVFFFAALLAFIFIVIGGLQWITAGGDKAAAQAARDRITAAVVGLIIVVAAFAITLIITTILGVNIFSGVIVFPGAERNAF